MQLSNDELISQAEEVDALHRDGMSALSDQIHEIHSGEVGGFLADSRRRFLTKAGAGAALLTAGSMFGPVTRYLSVAAAAELTDTDLAVFAESVELAAVAAYTAAVGTGKLSATATTVGTLFVSHHTEHAAVFANLAGSKATGKANAKLVADLAPMITGAADEMAILNIAMAVENQAAATYAFALGVLTNEAAYSGMATILPIEAQHAVVLGNFLGKPLAELFPSGNSAFESTTDIVDPAKYPVA